MKPPRAPVEGAQGLRPLLMVDGYNILGAWGAFKQNGWSLEEARDQLLHRLVDYAGYAGLAVLLVFDGHQTHRKQRTEETHGAVSLVYTRHGESADQYIEAAAGRHPKYRPLIVATSDSVEQTLVLGRGAVRISARELLRDIESARGQGQKVAAPAPVKGNTFESFLSPQQQAQLERLRREK